MARRARMEKGTMNIVALDAQHRDDGTAGVGMLGFHDWCDTTAAWERTLMADDCGEYEPGAFYKRELPALSQALAQCPVVPDVIVVDAYVCLDEHGREGLGYKLWEHLGRGIPVVGVAKTSFASAPPNWAICRGSSKKTLFVTSVGYDLEQAKADILAMHGAYRMPALLKRVDHLARQALLRSSGS